MALILEQCGFDSREDLPVLSQPAQVLWTGLLIMADWIASNERYFPLISAEEDGTSVDYDRRVSRAMDRLSLTKPWIPEEVWDAEQLYQERFCFSPNEVQKMVAQAVADEEYRRAAMDYNNRQKIKEQNAGTYCVKPPEEDEEDPGIYDWLGTTYSDSKANAAVRDGDPSIEVLCLRWGPNEKLYGPISDGAH